MSRGKADLGGIVLPLDDVENGNVAILVGPAQVLLNAGAHLRKYHSGQFFLSKSPPSYSSAGAAFSSRQGRLSSAHSQSLGLMSTV